MPTAFVVLYPSPIMAFVTPLPISQRTSPLSLRISARRLNVCSPLQTRRSRVCLMTADSGSATVYRVVRESDIDAVYTVWKAVAESEDLPSPKRDDRDGEETTAHILARSSEGHVVGAARLLRDGPNARLDRVCVLAEHRGKGIGRAMVERLLVLAAPVQGAIYVNATHGAEMGFFSILGFERIGNDRVENGVLVRPMVYRIPVCAPSVGCVGLHHTSIRVSDIERSLAFYGCLGFFVTDKFFTSAGNRACYVEGLGARLEFVESPDGKGGLTGVQGVPPAGFDRLVFDVTKACTDLDSYLQHLQRRNGGSLTVAGPPATQIIGASVVSVASVLDPDGLPIEFIKQEAQVPGELRTRVNW